MKDPASIIAHAEGLLSTACDGLDDMKRRPGRARTGLHSAIMAGRAITFALQNLRSFDASFDSWYAVKQDEMKGIRSMKFIGAARTQIEKQAGSPFNSAVYLSSFNSESIRSLAEKYPPPEEGCTLFMGDTAGGSGWLTPDGRKFYLDIQGSGARDGFFDTSVDDVSQGHASDMLAEYIGYMDKLISEAKVRFVK